MSDTVTFRCPHCLARLSAPTSLFGTVIKCSACGRGIHFTPPKRPGPPPSKPSSAPLPETRVPGQSGTASNTEAATDRQADFIRSLGGEVPPGLTKEQASERIDDLRRTAPPTRKQLDLLGELGASIPPDLTAEQASELISRLNGNKAPTRQQIKFIKMLGGEVPATKREASERCETLSKTAPATSQQIRRALELGTPLPQSATFAEANELLEASEMDADEVHGRPPSNAQISRIVKLGGDPAKVTNAWRADEYVNALEEQQEELTTRAEEVLDFVFGDTESRSIMSVRKPSRKVMEQALLYGDTQGWEEGWEDHDLVDVAVYAVAPELLKRGESPPRMPGTRATGKRGNGCLVALAVLLVVVLLMWALA